jgi:hypothetical protein
MRLYVRTNAGTDRLAHCNLFSAHNLRFSKKGVVTMTLLFENTRSCKPLLAVLLDPTFLAHAAPRLSRLLNLEVRTFAICVRIAYA